MILQKNGIIRLFVVLLSSAYIPREYFYEDFTKYFVLKFLILINNAELLYANAKDNLKQINKI